jgi:FdhD protein
MSLSPVSVRVNVRKLDLASKLDEMIEDYVAVEVPIEVTLNSRPVATLLATPTQTEDLALGMVIDEGLIEGVANIIDVRALGNTVNIEAKDSAIRKKNLRDMGLILSACGSTIHEEEHDGISWPSVQSNFKVKAQDVVQMVRKLCSSSVYFPKTGATHSATAFLQNEMKAFAEDVGRHNAIDKVIGSCARQRLDLSRTVLVTTGRQPAGLVLKAARVGIPIVVSMRGPIHSGILAADRTGITLVCFARGSRMNIYTHPDRIMV